MNKIIPFGLLAGLPASAERHAAVQRFLVGAVSPIQRNRSQQGGGKLLGVRVVGAAAAPCRLPFNSIIVGFAFSSILLLGPLSACQNKKRTTDFLAALVVYCLISGK